jgi:hypothetical protein
MYIDQAGGSSTPALVHFSFLRGEKIQKSPL